MRKPTHWTYLQRCYINCLKYAQKAKGNNVQRIKGNWENDSHIIEPINKDKLLKGAKQKFWN